MRFLLLILVYVAVIVPGCGRQAGRDGFPGNTHLNRLVDEMSDIMLHDVTNPPLAARFFSYAMLSGYEIVSQHDSAYQSMVGKLKEYPSIKLPDSIKGYDYQVAALLAVVETASRVQPSGKRLESYRNIFLDSCRQYGYDEETLASSLSLAKYVTGRILQYAKADRYNRISNLPRYSPAKNEGSWFPTPPGFMAAVEPYFHTIRAFTLDSSTQFRPPAPAPFSLDKNSGFQQMLAANYNEGQQFPEDSLHIAAYWDCNPFALQDGGHMQVGLKKISPGAHWLGITGIACGAAGKDFKQSLQIHTAVSIALMDGFLVCWEEKFRSNRVRPETAIRRLLDPSWRPLLQTPPFPEYPSGHSTISAAAAVVLTKFLGDDFKYTDTVEVKFGLPAREFSSFHAAADEAGMSRFYGGIHFMDAILNGREQGLEIGRHVLTVMDVR